VTPRRPCRRAQVHASAALLTRGVYETRAESRAGMGEGEGRQYFAGGFYGGEPAAGSRCGDWHAPHLRTKWRTKR
jgi:hypothetical protein